MAQGTPSEPVRLFKNEDDPCVCQLHVASVEQVGLLFKLCELLTSHGIDIVSADVASENGIVKNCFELHTSRPSDFNDAQEWCKELEEFLARSQAQGGSTLEGSLAAVSKRLSVNPDLLSVVSFNRLPDEEGPAPLLRYSLELEGINQAGLLTYAALVLYRSGFSVDHATISTVEGHVSDSFQLSARSPEAEQLLRSYLDVPFAQRLDSKESVPLPFHVSPSDCNLEELMHMWTKNPLLHSPTGSFSGSPRNSRAGSLDAEDLDGFVQRSRILSSDREEPTVCRTQSKEAVGDSPPSASGVRGSTAASKRDTRRMFVHFANGDVYTGSCAGFEDGQKRHGLGTYIYSPGTHESYKQYRGQWREDKKHGYGVLFYRNGGVYVGQWENNQKHGLGVLLDNTGETDAAQMPTFRYEGQWCEDEPHGLGAEESDMSSYFGHFSHGKRQGRGVRMNLAKMGSAGCEVVDGTGNVVPLLDALEAEMQSLSQPEAGGFPGHVADFADASATYHFGSSHEAGVRPSLAAIDFGPPSSSPARPADVASTPAQAPTPMQALQWAAGPSSRRGNSEHESGSSEKNSSETRSPMSTHQHFASPDCQETTPMPMQAGGSKPRAPQGPTPNQGRRASSPRLWGEGGNTAVSGGSVEFSMTEENNLLSPPECALTRPIPEEVRADAPTPRATGSGSAAERPPPGVGANGGKKPGSSSELPGVAPLDGRTASSGVGSERKAGWPLRPVRTPLLWSEDELAAFIACLGVGSEICRRVQARKLKGVVHLLEMSNSELRKEFALTSPVERLMVRQSLKRLLDADRWENSVRGHKVGDLLSDSVLGPFIVPLEELTLVTKISQGGYGTVYRGVLEPAVERGSLAANRSHLVAVKEMRGERRVRLYELLKEACVMASLNHPNICTFLGVCANSAAKKHFIISELMDCSLYDLVHQPYKLRWHGELTVALVVSLSKAICAGIAYLHGRNLVHADLKSSNILIDYSSSWQLIPRICDFGHAAVRTFPSPHHRCGTPHWAGPEVLRSEALGPAADIYSFGVIMWEMLAQKLPHKGLSFGQVVAAVGWAGWIPDMSLLPEIPQDIKKLLRECLSFSPFDRPTSKDVQRRLHKIPKRARLKALRTLLAFLSAC